MAVELLRLTLSEWWSDDVPKLAAALAFYTIFSLAPVLLIAMAVASAIFGRAAAREEVMAWVATSVGSDGAALVRNILDQARKSSPLATTIGVGAILVGASAVFVQLQDSLNQVWEIATKPEKQIRLFLRKRALSFLMVLAIGLLLLASVTLTTILSATTEAVQGYLHIPAALLTDFHLGLSLVLMALLFALIFKVLPDAEIAWRDVWIGAAATSVLFNIGKELIGLYLGRSSVGSAYGAAGSLAILLVWVYYSAQVFFLGAEFIQVYARYRGARIMPAPYATRIRRNVAIEDEE